MEAVQNWSREYFLANQEECLKRLSILNQEERACLRSNLNFKENGSLVLINHFFVTDIKEPEFYCEKYELKKADGSARVEHGKFSERINIAEDEICEDPEKHLGERQSCIITESSSNNQWIKEHEISTIASNKRKLEVDTSQKHYLVRVYDSSEVLLNQLVEVIGFVFPSLTTNSMETDDFGDTIDQPPPYIIHAVVFKEQPHNNPLMLQLQGCVETQDDAYTDIHRILTQFMFNDEIAAQYMLCHLISSVYARVNDESLGKFTLNLICHSIPLEVLHEYIKNLYSFFECLVPNSLYIPLSIENLNTNSFVPKKDYTKNRLSSGVLQLPNNTHLVLDETKMENGKLNQAGVIAISDLSELIQTQKLSYDFQFYKIPYNTDYPILIISEGKSLLPSDFALPIKAVDADSIQLINESIKTGIHCIKPKLNAFRRYLTRCRIASFNIDDEETKMIEKDFVTIRESNTNFQAEDLHLLLVLSRLIGKSRGNMKLDKSCWEMAKQMEMERNARLENRNIKNEL